nr:hypothetical protein [Tanacetum cinerariifolium]
GRHFMAAISWSFGPVDCCEGFSLAKSNGDLSIVEGGLRERHGGDYQFSPLWDWEHGSN